MKREQQKKKKDKYYHIEDQDEFGPHTNIQSPAFVVS